MIFDADSIIGQIIQASIEHRSKRPDTMKLTDEQYSSYQEWIKNKIGDKSKAYFAGFPMEVCKTDGKRIEFWKDGKQV